MTQAVRAWRAVLGEERVRDDAATLDRYARTTQPRGTRPCCVVYPATTDEVRAVVRIASEHGVVLYPISRGRNWGYGDACAPTDGAAIVDLSRMNRILEVNRELAYAVIEPGVSQGQFYEYLSTNKTGLWMDCTGAGPDASLVGNMLERGFGHTRYGDHIQTTCGMEIVLADGRVVNTGFGHYANAKAKYLYRYGVGPFIDGLFSQSNFGIVTKIGVWLMPEPERFCFFFINLERDEDIEPLIDRLRPLRLAGVLDSAVHIANDYRIFSSRMRYPFNETGGVTPLPDELRVKFRRALDIGAWNVAGSIGGTPELVRGARRALRRAIDGLGRLVFVDDRLARRAESILTFLNRFGLAKRYMDLLVSVRPVFATAKGIPTTDAIRGTYWRLRQDPPPGDVADPLEAGAGVMWVSPVLPMFGRDARQVMAIVEPIFKRYRFEPLATFTLINERAVIGVLNMAFDHNVPEEVAAAEHCYKQSIEALAAAGYPLYRTGPDTFGSLVNMEDPFWQVVTQIKAALDPKDIIARGRYVPALNVAATSGAASAFPRVDPVAPNKPACGDVEQGAGRVV